MGCDIHGVVERKVKDKWIAVGVMKPFHSFQGVFETPASVSRNYERFAALAGVRGEGPEARGLPDDASETTRLLFDEGGDHTPSWLPLIEAADIYRKTDRMLGGGRPPLWDLPEYYYFGISQDNLEDYRFVFWFDS